MGTFRYKRKCLKIPVQAFLEFADGCGFGCKFLFKLFPPAVSQFLLRHLSDTDGTFVILYYDGAADGKAKLFKRSSSHLPSIWIFGTWV